MYSLVVGCVSWLLLIAGVVCLVVPTRVLLKLLSLLHEASALATDPGNQKNIRKAQRLLRGQFVGAVFTLSGTIINQSCICFYLGLWPLQFVEIPEEIFVVVVSVRRAIIPLSSCRIGLTSYWL